MLSQPHCYPVVHGSHYLDSLFAAIAEAYANPVQGRDALVERHYHPHWPVSSYAHQLGVSTVYLNGICRQQTGWTALKLVQQRQILETKRLLVYTALNVNPIVNQLGFSEPAHFIRFFKCFTGQTPSRLHKGEVCYVVDW